MNTPKTTLKIEHWDKIRAAKYAALTAEEIEKGYSAEPEPCPNCNGYGEVTAGDPDIGQEERGEQCAACEGTGERDLLILSVEAEVTTPLPEGRL